MVRQKYKILTALLGVLFLWNNLSTTSSSSDLSYIDPVTGMEFVFVQGGCYIMGDQFDDGYDGEFPHEVCLDDYYIGKYEVTQGEYQKVFENNPSVFKKGDNYPVEWTSWNDTQSFIAKLNKLSSQKYRLPTEAEWEYAARSGGKKEKFSGSHIPDTIGWYDEGIYGSTHPVGSKLPNGLDIYDMTGNVREWCEDWYNVDYYGISPRMNPKGPPSGFFRALRGGSWQRPEKHIRAAYRDCQRPDDLRKDVGFRLVLPGRK